MLEHELQATLAMLAKNAPTGGDAETVRRLGQKRRRSRRLVGAGAVLVAVVGLGAVGGTILTDRQTEVAAVDVDSIENPPDLSENRSPNDDETGQSPPLTVEVDDREDSEAEQPESTVAETTASTAARPGTGSTPATSPSVPDSASEVESGDDPTDPVLADPLDGDGVPLVTTSTTAPQLDDSPWLEAMLEFRIFDPTTDEVFTYSISCGGDRAELTGDGTGFGLSAKTMCERLDTPEVQERLIEGAPTRLACTQVYGGPQSASVTGTLGGVAVSAGFGRSNGCALSDWSRRMADLLPELTSGPSPSS